MSGLSINISQELYNSLPEFDLSSVLRDVTDVASLEKLRRQFEDRNYNMHTNLYQFLRTHVLPETLTEMLSTPMDNRHSTMVRQLSEEPEKHLGRFEAKDSGGYAVRYALYITDGWNADHKLVYWIPLSFVATLPNGDNVISMSEEILQKARLGTTGDYKECLMELYKTWQPWNLVAGKASYASIDQLFDDKFPQTGNVAGKGATFSLKECSNEAVERICANVCAHLPRLVYMRQSPAYLLNEQIRLDYVRSTERFFKEIVRRQCTEAIRNLKKRLSTDDEFRKATEAEKSLEKTQTLVEYVEVLSAHKSALEAVMSGISKNTISVGTLDNFYDSVLVVNRKKTAMKRKLKKLLVSK